MKCLYPFLFCHLEIFRGDSPVTVNHLQTLQQMRRWYPENDPPILSIIKHAITRSPEGKASHGCPLSPTFPTEPLTQMNILWPEQQQETAGFALADLSCCSASSVDLNDRLALLRVVFIHFLTHRCTQVDATLCRTKARKSLSARGRSRCGCVLKDRPRHSRGHLPWHARSVDSPRRLDRC